MRDWFERDQAVGPSPRPAWERGCGRAFGSQVSVNREQIDRFILQVFPLPST